MLCHWEANYGLVGHGCFNVFTYCFFGLFPETMAECSSCKRECMAHKAYNIYYLALYKGICQSLVYIICPEKSADLSGSEIQRGGKEMCFLQRRRII